MATSIWVQILDEPVYIEHCAITFEKVINPIIFSPATGTWIDEAPNLGIATSLGEGKLWIFNLLNSVLKIDLVSHPDHVEGFVNIYIYIYIYSHSVHCASSGVMVII